MKRVNDPWIAYESSKDAPESSKTVDKHEVDVKKIVELIDRKYEKEEEIREDFRNHSLFTWGASRGASENSIIAERTEGIYIYDMEGKKYIDFTSQAKCVNLGHTCPPNIVKAVKEQLEGVFYTWPLLVSHKLKGKASALLASVMPGDLDYTFFTSAGAESNESAIRMARRFTKKTKIISFLRSYHGGTKMASALTGEPRRRFAIGDEGVIHVVGPQPLTYSWGKTEEEQTEASLNYLAEVIENEGPETIAAIIMEPVVGTNGILVPPKGYLNGIRNMCDAYGILMICDEVMAGWGRSGPLFGFMHSDPIIIPDIVTMAKGLTSSFVPLGAVVVRKEIGEYFMDVPIGVGSTYSSHPVALACMIENIRYFFESDVLGNVQKAEKKTKELMQKMMDKHKCIKQCRCTGCFGMVDFQKDAKGTPFAKFLSPPPAELVKFKNVLKENGLLTLVKGSSFYCNPPLIITEAELEEAWAIIDKGLEIIDEAFEES